MNATVVVRFSVASQATPARTAPPLVKTGKYGRSHYTYQEDTKGFGSFFFEPPLAADDTVVIGAMRALLSDAYKIDLRNSPEPRLVPPFMRFITGQGVYDLLVAKDERLRVLAISVIRR
jgi:hypothetical protein